MTEKPERNDEPEVRTEELADQDLDQVSGGIVQGGGVVPIPIVERPGRMHPM